MPKDVMAGIKSPIDDANTTIFNPDVPLRTNKGNGLLDGEVRKATGKARQIEMVANPIRLRNGKRRLEVQGRIAKTATMVKPNNLVVFQSKNGRSFAAAKIGAGGKFKINIDTEKDLQTFLNNVVVVDDDAQLTYFNYCTLPMDIAPPLETMALEDVCFDLIIVAVSTLVQNQD